ncbi:MAG: aminotransferase class IV [Lewinellaceae bacterium]|nr:aminotransferase class IV [Phaeodactylibacter sp.]MCB9040475.1 aminotransferase class IV [Lewinellaceae bacterium]
MKKLLLETIRCEGGHLQNLEWHQERVTRSCRDLFLHYSYSINLQDIKVPPEAEEGLYKCRVLYDMHIKKVEFTPYSIRPLKKLRLVLADGLDYSYKYAGRAKIMALLGRRGAADDILMVKNGLITDTSYANVALFDGARWVTPAAPLLPGTRRAALLAGGRLSSANIPPQSISEFQEIRLFNAMMDLEEGPRLKPGDIFNL